MALDGDLERVDETIDRVERITRTRKLREQPWTVRSRDAPSAASRPAEETGGRCCVKFAGLLQRFAAFLYKTGARTLDKSLTKLLAKNTGLDGVQGVECSNHFAPTNNQVVRSLTINQL